ncbi:hypothetical protein SLA2020_441300 [Shorea laevis]
MYVLPCAHAQIQHYIFMSDKHPLSPTQSKHSRNLRISAKPAGELALDCRVFDEIPVSDTHTFAWNNLMQIHLANQDFDLVISTYQQMLLRGTARPDRRTLPRVLTASWRSGDILSANNSMGTLSSLGSLPTTM